MKKKIAWMGQLMLIGILLSTNFTTVQAAEVRQSSDSEVNDFISRWFVSKDPSTNGFVPWGGSPIIIAATVSPMTYYFLFSGSGGIFGASARKNKLSPIHILLPIPRGYKLKGCKISHQPLYCTDCGFDFGEVDSLNGISGPAVASADIYWWHGPHIERITALSHRYSCELEQN